MAATLPIVEVRRSMITQFTSLDLSLPIHIIPTSFLATSDSVAKYIGYLNEKKHNTPYEYVQNQVDHNDDARGTPEIWIAQKNGNPVTFPAFIRMNAEQIKQVKANCPYVEHRNHIVEGRGLTPQNLIAIDHPNGMGTLGSYGWGSRLAGTALVASHHASNITYESCDNTGPWRGEAIMAVGHYPDQHDPCFTIGYQRPPQSEPVTQTIIKINNPSDAYLQCLYDLPHHFLLVNPKYEYYRFNHSKDITPTPNMFTAHVDLPPGQADKPNKHTAGFTMDEKNNFNINPATKYREPPRVEILPWDISSIKEKPPDRTDYVYVDGVNLTSSHTKNLALRWSFWGFDKAEDGWRAKRNPDSTCNLGNPNQLIATTLGKCTNEKVFETIFEASLKEPPCYEGEIPKKELIETMKQNPLAHTALDNAWFTFCRKHKLDFKHTLVTADEKANKKAKAARVKSLFLNAPSIVDCMHELKIARKLEETIELVQDLSGTNEVRKISIFTEAQLPNDFMTQSFIDLLFEHNAALTFHKDGFFIDLPCNPPLTIENIQLMRNIRAFRTSFDDIWGKFGPSGYAKTTIDPGKKEAYELEERPREMDWDSHNIYIYPADRTIPSSGKPFVRIQLLDMPQLDGYEAYIRELRRRFQKVSVDGQHVDAMKLAEAGTNRLAGLQQTIYAEQMRLQTVQAQILDAQRQLGFAIEDGLSAGPTRSTLRPNPRTDFQPPQGFRRQGTVLYNMISAPLARNAFGLEDDNEAPNPSRSDIDRINTPEEARAYLAEHLEAIKRPDIQLLRPQSLPPAIRDTLICRVNPLYSSSVALRQIDFENKRDLVRPGLLINQRVNAGEYAVPCFTNCKLTGFYHPDPLVANQLRFATSKEHGVFSLHSDITIPPGIEFYYEYDPSIKPSWTPDKSDSTPLADINLLKPSWQRLINHVNNKVPPLNPKEKLDIAITAWVYAFKYSKDPRVDDYFRDLPPEARYAEILNRATGNCGYAAEGFITLCRFFNLPAIEMLGYLGENGRYFPGLQNHALASVHLGMGDDCVIVEPQMSYISQGYKRRAVAKEFMDLIQMLPRGKNIFPKIERSTAPIGMAAVIKQLRAKKIQLDEETEDMFKEFESILKQDSEIFKPYFTDEPAIPGFGIGSLTTEDIMDEVQKILQYSLRRGHISQTTPIDIAKGGAVLTAGAASILLAHQMGLLSGIEQPVGQFIHQLLTSAPGEVTGKGKEIPIPQTIDTLRIDTQLLASIIIALLSSSSTMVFDAIRYNRIINRLKARISYENR